MNIYDMLTICLGIFSIAALTTIAVLEHKRMKREREKKLVQYAEIKRKRREIKL